MELQLLCVVYLSGVSSLVNVVDASALGFEITRFFKVIIVFMLDSFLYWFTGLCVIQYFCMDYIVQYPFKYKSGY